MMHPNSKFLIKTSILLRTKHAKTLGQPGVRERKNWNFKELNGNKRNYATHHHKNKKFKILLFKTRRNCCYKMTSRLSHWTSWTNWMLWRCSTKCLKEVLVKLGWCRNGKGSSTMGGGYIKVGPNSPRLLFCSLSSSPASPLLHHQVNFSFFYALEIY